jgi:DNA repair exonuclease SbcCD ATPase subunit
MSRYRAVVRGGSRPPEEVIRETVEVPLEACPECGGPLEDRATHEQVEEKGRLEPDRFEARLQELEAKLSARIAEKRRFTDRDNARLARRLRKRRFLRVEPPGGAGPPTGGPGPQDGGL